MIIPWREGPQQDRHREWHPRFGPYSIVNINSTQLLLISIMADLRHLVGVTLTDGLGCEEESTGLSDATHCEYRIDLEKEG